MAKQGPVTIARAPRYKYCRRIRHKQSRDGRHSRVAAIRYLNWSPRVSGSLMVKPTGLQPLCERAGLFCAARIRPRGSKIDWRQEWPRPIESANSRQPKLRKSRPGFAGGKSADSLVLKYQRYVPATSHSFPRTRVTSQSLPRDRQREESRAGSGRENGAGKPNGEARGRVLLGLHSERCRLVALGA
jgi:hypothetical protein